MRRPISIIATALLVAACSGAASPAPSIAPSSPSAELPTATPTKASPTAAPAPKSALTDLLPPLPAGSLDATTATSLQGVLDDLVASGAPDAIGAVITADGQWTGAAGIDGPDGRAADPGDWFAINGKAMVATLVLRLAQDGRMDLDAPLADYLGDLPVDANGATVREALGHRSGIGGTPAGQQEAAAADCGRAWSRAEVLALVPDPKRPAGIAVDYSNPTYKLLAVAAEQVTGTSLDVAYQDLVFDPLDLDRMLMQIPTRPTPKPWSLPIAGHEGGIDLASYGIGGMLPCAGVLTFSFQNAVASDASNLARFGWGLFSAALLDRDHLVAMTTVSPADSSDDNDLQGLGFEQIPDFYFGGLSYSTGGNGDGYGSFMAILPERQIVAVVFINDGRADRQGATQKLIRALGG